MKKRNLSKNSKQQRVKRERDPLPLRYCLLTIVCGLILVAGFFWAARQHFMAMDYGIRNAKLRQQKEDLQSEQRRLYLTREISLSPAEIKKAAKKIGLQKITANNIEVIDNKASTINPLAEKAATEKPKQAFLPIKENKLPIKGNTQDKQIKEDKKQTGNENSSDAKIKDTKNQKQITKSVGDK